MEVLRTLRRKQFAYVVLGITASLILYQNCSGHSQTAGVGSYSSCQEDCSSAIQIQIQNTSPILVRTSDRRVDIAGVCNVRGTALSKIYYQLNGTGAPKSEVDSGAGCNDRGRFHVQVELPTGYRYAENYQVDLRLVGLSDEGGEIGHPMGAHKDSARLAPAGF